MGHKTAGEWDKWEEWMLRSHLIDLENDASEVREEIRRRAKIVNANFTRDERKAQIKRILADGTIRTTSQIAKALGMSPSQHLRNILCELYRDGTILAYAENTVAAHPIYYWYIQATLPLPSPDFQRNPVCNEDYIDIYSGVTPEGLEVKS